MSIEIMNQDVIERMFDHIVETFDYAIQRNNLDSQIEHLRSTSKSLISIISLFNQEGIDGGLISDEVLKANIERKTNLEKIYLSLDEIRPNWLFDEMKAYAYFASQISKARRNGTIKKVEVKVLETFKAPRSAPKFSDFLNEGLKSTNTEESKEIVKKLIND